MKKEKKAHLKAQLSTLKPQVMKGRKKAHLKAQHSTVYPQTISRILSQPLSRSAASSSSSLSRTRRSPPPVPLPLSLAATSACRCRLFLSLSRTRPLPPAPSVRRRPTARGCSSLTSDLRPPRGPPTPIGEAGPLRPARKRDWAPSRRRLAEHGYLLQS